MCRRKILCHTNYSPLIMSKCTNRNDFTNYVCRTLTLSLLVSFNLVYECPNNIVKKWVNVYILLNVKIMFN